MEYPNTIVPEFLRLNADYQNLSADLNTPPIISIASRVSGSDSLFHTGIEVSGDPDQARQQFAELLAQRNYPDILSTIEPETRLSDQKWLVSAPDLNRIYFSPSQSEEPQPNWNSAAEIRRTADILEAMAPDSVKHLLVTIGRSALNCELSLYRFGYEELYYRLQRDLGKKVVEEMRSGGFSMITLAISAHSTMSLYAESPGRGGNLFAEGQWLTSGSLL